MYMPEVVNASCRFTPHAADLCTNVGLDRRQILDGLHRHALMTMIAYAFLQTRRLKAAGRKKKNRGTAATTEPAGHHASHP